jgi:predicted nucleic acid-binding protein
LTPNSPTFVLDASVAVKWFLRDEPHVAEAGRVLGQWRAHELALVAPDVIVHEVANGLARGSRMKRISSDASLVGLQDFLGLHVVLISSFRLAREGLVLAQRLGIGYYDALYGVVGDVLGYPTLTADDRMHDRMAAERLPVVHLRDYH